MKLDAGTIYENPVTFRFEPSISPPRYSTSIDYRNSSYESRNSSDDSRMSPFIENGSTCSSSSRIHIVLSTPSPSAYANGELVDKEIGRLNKISETWRKHKDFDESDANALGLEREHLERVNSVKSASIVPDSKLFRKRKSSSRSRSASPVNNAPCPVHSNLRSVSRERELSRQSTPNRFSPKRDDRNGRKVRSSQSPGPQNYTRQYRRSSSYDGIPVSYTDKRARSPSPLTDVYRRSLSYSDKQKSQLFRTRPTSPGLNPSIGSGKINAYNNTGLFYPKSQSLSSSREKVSLYKNIFSRNSSQDDSSDTQSVHSSISLTRDIFKNENKFSTFPRRRQSKKGRPSLDNQLFDNHSEASDYSMSRSSPNREVRGKQYSSYSVPVPVNDNNDRGSTYQSPDYSNRMSTSPRKLSEENSLSRLPLATLHEDGCTIGYNDNREKSLDRDFLDDYYNEQRKLSEAGVRKLSGVDPSAILTEDTDSFIIGDRVWVGGTKAGKISFIGETHFGTGDWAGVTLDEAIGKNDGSVGSYRYFQCESRKGVFSRLSRLARYPSMMSGMSPMGTDLDFIADTIPDYSRSSYSPARRLSPSYESPKRASPSPVDTKKSVGIEPARKVSPFPVRNGSAPNSRRGSSPLSSRRGSSPLSTSNNEVRIGDAVVITGTSGIKNGVLRFIGKTEFAEGLWGGVELNDASGRNDGSVAGKKYGLFAPMVRISKKGRESPSRSSITPTRTYGKDASRVSPSYREAPKYGLGSPNKAYKGKETNSFDADIFY